MTQKEKDIKRLIKHIAKEDVVPFLGSGFSLKAGAPSVWSLKEVIVEDGGPDFAEEVGDLKKISLAELSEKHIEYNGGSRNALLALLKRLFELQPKDLSDHEYLRRIPHFRTLYTTNYETFIETAYPVSELLVVNSNESYTFVGSKPITLYKIHGDLSTLSSPDSVVISTTDYKEYFKGKRFEHLWTQFKTDAGKRTLLFIGYSLEDPNILNIIKNVRKLSGGSAKEWFLV
ncbi:MAG: SIR2 family protein, partial [Muribaculaceae bacterium]|nr:SIR2 family protein [Muribaculaceae bacterium]